MKIAHPKQHISSGAIILTIFGVLFFFYGFILSIPTLLRSTLLIRASLLSPFLGEASEKVHQSASAFATDPASAEGAFTIALFLIIAGAAIDVWNRLHRLHSSEGSVSIFDFIDEGHDNVLEESHIW